MNTDRELLEAAAKAAGLLVKSDRDSTWIVEDDGSPVRRWLPLTDDGEALRLAARLYLWEAVRLAHREVSGDVDIYAATRRSIVRAAAAIGANLERT